MTALYAYSSGSSYLHHMTTLNAIDQAGRRVETTVHSGLMSLATHQAKAMRELGTRIDDRMVQIDTNLLEQSRQISRIQSGIASLDAAIKVGFSAISDHLGDIERSLDRIEQKVSNPEEARAWERFRRADGLRKSGHPAEALRHIDAAIEDDGGPGFRHIPEFQVLKGGLHMGDASSADPSIIDPQKAHDAFCQAVQFAPASTDAEKKTRSGILASAGYAAYAAGRPQDALTLLEKSFAYAPHPNGIHFLMGKCALLIGDHASARSYLRAAIEADWSLVTAVAADGDYAAHADVVGPMIRAFRNDLLEKVRPGARAALYLFGGAYARNFEKMRQMIYAATHPEGYHGHAKLTPNGDPAGRSASGLYSRYEYWMTNPEKAALEVVGGPDAGVMDIRAALDPFLKHSRNITYTANGILKGHDRMLCELRKAVEDGYIPRSIRPFVDLPHPQLETSHIRPQSEDKPGFFVRLRPAYKRAQRETEMMEAANTAAHELDAENNRRGVEALRPILHKLERMMESSMRQREAFYAFVDEMRDKI